MRGAQKVLCVAATIGVVATGVSPASAITWEERSAGSRAFYTAAAVVANIVPITSAFVAPRCLQGYVLCKITFAGISLVAAAESLFMSGGADKQEPDTLIERGFSGDWFLTGRHVAGDVTPEPYPEVATPPTTGGDGDFTPPPI